MVTKGVLKQPPLLVPSEARFEPCVLGGLFHARLVALETMTSLHIEYRPTESLIPYARNARTHSTAQVAQLAASIREFGFTNPVLVDGRHGIIAGHGRVLAARMLDLDELPVIELAHLSETQ